MGSADRQRESIDDLDALLSSLPPEIVAAVHALPDKEELIEVVMDLGRRPEARFPDSEVTLLEREIGRLREARESKENTRAAASAFFRIEAARS